MLLTYISRSRAGFVELVIAGTWSHKVYGGSHSPSTWLPVLFTACSLMEQYARLIFAFTISKNSVNANFNLQFIHMETESPVGSLFKKYRKRVSLSGPFKFNSPRSHTVHCIVTEKGSSVSFRFRWERSGGKKRFVWDKNVAKLKRHVFENLRK